MHVSIPIYVENSRARGGPVPVYRCQPLMFACTGGVDESLSRAISKLARHVRKHLDELGKQSRHEELARAAWAPDLHDQRVKFIVDLRRARVPMQVLVVWFRALGRRVAFTPRHDGPWFEIADGVDVAARASEVLTRYYRDLEKQGAQAAARIRHDSLDGKAWIAWMDLELTPRQTSHAEAVRQWAALWDESHADGGTELTRVGRCLDWLYPDHLQRALLRDREVAQLERLLAAPDRRPVLLVGPRQAGKTTIVHECVYRRVARSLRPSANRNNVWLLSPQRLIAGMSYVGQWENRLLAILKEAGRKNHVLYFNDVLGLYQAGISCQSNLSVAHVLSGYIERRQVRVLAEITPQALCALQELDRGLADQFHILHVPETGELESLRILIAALRQLEGQYRVRFDVDVLPTVVDLLRRYARDVAFPGNAAGFLRHLAVKRRGLQASRDHVFQEFHARTGLAVTFLDHRARLSRQEVLAGLRTRLVGQDATVDAAADAILIAKARLNDVSRPLASLLFLGPTGVGKTQCAKAIAQYLFGSADKLLRLDMNEFISASAAARLVGTVAEPEGLLTIAVRRQPFSVVLLDEIEKAHPDVFDLLLQVTGEARLTDALGRTTDFSNTILIMTSNLGAGEAGASRGFSDGEANDAAYVLAARQFFRPEFFNRLDRIVPFTRLNRDEVWWIAELVIRDVFAREGLHRRRCILHVDRRAMEKVVDLGYHPQWGARALKRAVEEQLTQPVATYLSSLGPNAPTAIGLFPRPKGIAVQVQPLMNATRSAPAAAAAIAGIELVNRSGRVLERLAAVLDRCRPAGGLSPDEITPGVDRYLLLQEQILRVKGLMDDICEHQERLRGLHEAPRLNLSPPHRQQRWRELAQRRFMQELWAAEDVNQYLRDLAADSRAVDKGVGPETVSLRRELALLQAIADSEGDPDRVVLVIRPLVAWANLERFRDSYVELFKHALSLDVMELYQGDHPDAGLVVALALAAPHAWPLACGENGTHLICQADGQLTPVQVHALAVPADRRPTDVFEAFAARRRDWILALARGEASVDDDPLLLQPVVRICQESGATLDLRSGLSLAQPPNADQMRELVLANLPLPPELSEQTAEAPA